MDPANSPSGKRRRVIPAPGPPAAACAGDKLGNDTDGNVMNETQTSKEFASDNSTRLPQLERELRDAVWVRCLKAAFEGAVNDKVVLDLYSGLGIRALLAARAGARAVYAVERPSVAAQLRRIVAANGLECTITVIALPPGERLRLPVSQVDVITSLWMGDAVLFGSRIRELLHVRDRFLSASGVIIPSHATLYLAGVAEQYCDVGASRYKSKQAWRWDDVYGLDMGCIGPLAQLDSRLVDLDPAQTRTKRCAVRSFNVMECELRDLSFSASFDATAIAHDGTATVDALALTFEVSFEHVPHTQRFSTDPTSPKTQWKHTILYLPTATALEPGHTLRGRLRCDFPAAAGGSASMSLSKTVLVLRDPDTNDSR